MKFDSTSEMLRGLEPTYPFYEMPRPTGEGQKIHGKKVVFATTQSNVWII